VLFTTNKQDMEKYLVTVEFRYTDAPKGEYDSEYKSKTITIGVYDDFMDACSNGNAFLEKLESRYSIHRFPSGSEAKKERFSKTGGCFGSKNTLVTNLAYLRTPFAFYAKITTLKYEDADEAINSVLEALNRHKIYEHENNSN